MKVLLKVPLLIPQCVDFVATPTTTPLWKTLNESVDDISGSDPEEDLDDNFVRSVRSREKVEDVENPKPGPSNVGRNDPKGGRKKVKLKLKLITLRKENGKEKQGKAGRFLREGDYNDRFRLPYSRREEESIVQYFLCEGGYKYSHSQGLGDERCTRWF